MATTEATLSAIHHSLAIDCGFKSYLRRSLSRGHGIGLSHPQIRVRNYRIVITFLRGMGQNHISGSILHHQFSFQHLIAQSDHHGALSGALAHIFRHAICTRCHQHTAVHNAASSKVNSSVSTIGGTIHIDFTAIYHQIAIGIQSVSIRADMQRTSMNHHIAGQIRLEWIVASKGLKTASVISSGTIQTVILRDNGNVPIPNINILRLHALIAVQHRYHTIRNIDAVIGLQTISFGIHYNTSAGNLDIILSYDSVVRITDNI